MGASPLSPGDFVLAIPPELKTLISWVCWERDGEHKPPINPRTGRKASTSAPGTWGTFDEAVKASANHGGIGLVMRREDDLAAIDLDDCLIPGTRSIRDPAVFEIVARAASYTEVSPSMRGLRIFVRGTCRKIAAREGCPVEAYSHGQFVTVTGDHLAGTPKDIADGTEFLAWLDRTYGRRDDDDVGVPSAPYTGETDDALFAGAVADGAPGCRHVAGLHLAIVLRDSGMPLDIALERGEARFQALVEKIGQHDYTVKEWKATCRGIYKVRRAKAPKVDPEAFVHMDVDPDRADKVEMFCSERRNAANWESRKTATGANALMSFAQHVKWGVCKRLGYTDPFLPRVCAITLVILRRHRSEPDAELVRAVARADAFRHEQDVQPIVHVLADSNVDTSQEWHRTELADVLGRHRNTVGTWVEVLRREGLAEGGAGLKFRFTESGRRAVRDVRSSLTESSKSLCRGRRYWGKVLPGSVREEYLRQGRLSEKYPPLRSRVVQPSVPGMPSDAIGWATLTGYYARARRTDDKAVAFVVRNVVWGVRMGIFDAVHRRVRGEVWTFTEYGISGLHSIWGRLKRDEPELRGIDEGRRMWNRLRRKGEHPTLEMCGLGQGIKVDEEFFRTLSE